MKTYKRLFKESLPQEYIVRGNVREKELRRTIKGIEQYGIKQNDLIGWFANKYNIAEGWSIFKASDLDKKEFGRDVFRSYSEHTESTSIIKFNIAKGTYAFIDNEAYEKGIIKFQKFTKYDRIFIEPTDKAFKEFNIV